MARTVGARNQDHDAQREKLVQRVCQHLLAGDQARASLRDMAKAARTSVGTLRHYFGDRDGVLKAVFGFMYLQGAQHLATLAQPTSDDVRASLSWAVRYFVTGWDAHHVGRLQGFGLAVGLSEPAFQTTYLSSLLEPVLQAVESLLARHVERGHLEIDDVRHAALTLLSPLLLGLLHQHQLAGQTVRPLDVEAFTTAHLAAFFKIWPPKPIRRRRALG